MEPIYATPPSALAESPMFQGNPWFTMWTKPRRTVRYMLDTDPRRQVRLLAGLQGMVLFLQYAPVYAGSYPVLSWGGAILLGPILGLILWHFFAWLYTIAGQRLGGTATIGEIRCALAWSFVAAPWRILLILLQFLLMARDVEWAPISGIAFLVCGGIHVVAGIWQAVISILAMAEAHRYGAGRSFVAVLIIWLGCAVAIAAMGLAAVAFMSMLRTY